MNNLDKDKLVEKYTPYIKKMIYKYRGLYGVIDRDDLFQAGILGLLQAIDKFDDSKGVPFKTFAYHRINGAIIDTIRDVDIMPRIQRMAYNINVNNLKPTVKQKKLIQHFKETDKNYKVVAVDLPFWDFHDQGSEREIEKTNAKIIVERILENEEIGLKPKEKTILHMYYFQSLKLYEVANILGLTENAVNKSKMKAIKKIRAYLNQVKENGDNTIQD